MKQGGAVLLSDSPDQTHSVQVEIINDLPQFMVAVATQANQFDGMYANATQIATSVQAQQVPNQNGAGVQQMQPMVQAQATATVTPVPITS